MTIRKKSHPALEHVVATWIRARFEAQDRMARRTALVTGASYGVGAATALALAREGCDVAVSATRVENLSETMAKLAATGMRAVPLVLDLRAQASIERAMTDVLAALGQLDILINNAGSDLRKLA